MRDSKFLRKEDVGTGMLLTIEGCIQVNVAMSGAEPEMRWALTFEEEDRPMILRSTNAQMCAKIFGSDDTDDWTGQQIVLYDDPSIAFAGKIVGGIRVRAPRPKKPAPAPVQAPAQAQYKVKGRRAVPPPPEPDLDTPLDDEDSIPF
jgi:hypothetical protein